MFDSVPYYSIQDVQESGKEQFVESIAQTSNSVVVVTHAHCNPVSTKSQSWSCRMIHFGFTCHDGLCSDCTVFGYLCNKAKHFKDHVVVAVHASKAESDGNE